MKLVIQRVKNAKVEVDEKVVRKNRKWIHGFNWYKKRRY